MVFRMLQEFVAQTEGSDTAESSSEQHLMELMMSRYYVFCSEYWNLIILLNPCLALFLFFIPV
jgi:hypothetical protein